MAGLGPIQPESQAAPVTLRTIPRVLTVHGVTDAELDQIASTSTSLAINLTFFGIGVGAMVAFFIAAKAPSLDKSTANFYWTLFAIGLVTSAYCGVQSLLASLGQKRRVDSIKQRG